MIYKFIYTYYFCIYQICLYINTTINTNFQNVSENNNNS